MMMALERVSGCRTRASELNCHRFSIRSRQHAEAHRRRFPSVEVASGKRLVLAIEQDAKVDVLHACGGNARCTTCRVEFIEGEPMARPSQSNRCSPPRASRRAAVVSDSLRPRYDRPRDLAVDGLGTSRSGSNAGGRDHAASRVGEPVALRIPFPDPRDQVVGESVAKS